MVLMIVEAMVLMIVEAMVLMAWFWWLLKPKHRVVLEPTVIERYFAIHGRYTDSMFYNRHVS